MQKAIFRFGAHENYDNVLHHELSALRKANESKWYWVAALFIVDKIVEKANGITLYYVRRPRQRKDKVIILQSDWDGMQYFEVQ